MLGLTDGLVLGLVLGDRDGEVLGLALGETLGLVEGLTLGEELGEVEGLPLGEVLGDPDGEVLGDSEGEIVGLPLGTAVGLAVGALGDSVGSAVVGFCVDTARKTAFPTNVPKLTEPPNLNLTSRSGEASVSATVYGPTPLHGHKRV